MKKMALIATGLFCVGLLGACSAQGMESSNKSETKQTAKTGDSEQAGKKVQDFSLQGVDGKTYRLSDYKVLAWMTVPPAACTSLAASMTSSVYP